MLPNAEAAAPPGHSVEGAKAPWHATQSVIGCGMLNEMIGRRYGWLHAAVTLFAAVSVTACGGNGDGNSNSSNGSGAANSKGGAGGMAGGGGYGGSAVTVGGGGDLGDMQTYSLTIGPFDVPAGQEQTMCVILNTGNPQAGMLRTITTELTTGSHHMIVTRQNGGSPEPNPLPCGAFAHAGDALFIAEKPDMQLNYPNGAGMPFTANQLVGLEMHFINTTSGAMDISGTVHLGITTDVQNLKEVRLQFDGPLSISIPAQGTSESSQSYGVENGAQIFALTSHTHRLGVLATIERQVNGVTTELLHESTSWAEPPFDTFNPPLTLAPNEQLRITCNYNNPTDQEVYFGTGYYDEMCFLWAHYVLD